MKTLTTDQLIDAQAQLAFVKVLHQQVEERLGKQRAAITGPNPNVTDTLAYAVVTEAMLSIEQEHVDELAELLGVEDSEDKLATVIDIFDGNRRVGHG